MKETYIKHHTVVKTLLIEEIKLICDDYIGRKTSEDTLKYYVQFWASKCPELLFNGQEG